MSMKEEQKSGKRIYLTSVCGSGKTTFVNNLIEGYQRVISAGNIAEMCTSGKQVENIKAKGYSETYARQSALYHGTIDMMLRRDFLNDIKVFERTAFDWLVGGLLSKDPFTREKFKYFEKHLEEKLNFQKSEMWDRTRFFVIPSPTIAVLEKNAEHYLTGKRGEWYDSEFNWSGMSQTRKLRTLHESMLRAEFEIHNQIKKFMPESGFDCKLTLVRDLPTYAGKEHDVRTYFDWQKIVELTFGEFLMEY